MGKRTSNLPAGGVSGGGSRLLLPTASSALLQTPVVQLRGATLRYGRLGMADPNKKASSRTRQILGNTRHTLGRFVSYAVWREDVGLALVVQRKGKVWHNMGLQVRQNLFCNLIEAAFLSERCNLLMSKNGKILSVKDHFSLLVANEVTWQSYFSYVYLKRAGYSLFGKPLCWLNEDTGTLKALARIGKEGQGQDKLEVLNENDGKGERDLAEQPTAGNMPPAAKRRKIGEKLGAGEGEGTFAGAQQERGCRGWWVSVPSQNSWLCGLGPVPQHPPSMFNPTVLKSKTEAFPNLWSFGKRNTFSMDLDESSLQSFDVKLIGGNLPGRKKKVDFSLHVPKVQSKGLSWRQAHSVADLSKRSKSKPAKISFIDGASVCFFSLHDDLNHPTH